MLKRMSAPDASLQNVMTGAMHSSDPSLGSLCVLIPAWQPDVALLSLVTDLSRRGFGKLLIIDDGSKDDADRDNGSPGQRSTPACEVIFAQAAKLPGVDLQRHATNLGKGRALKTGFNCLLEERGDLLGVITADADGQHTPEDIERVARALLSSSPRPVLGSRGFEHGVPWRSRLGNALTRTIFGLLTGTRLADTQTGLRGFPLALLPELLTLGGERYEYEMTVLAYLCRSGRTPLEVPIATVYLDNNRESHFHPVWDSVRIYLVLLRSLFVPASPVPAARR